MSASHHQRWMSLTLAAAGIYSLAAGILLIAEPALPFSVVSQPVPQDPDLIHLIGLAVVLAGIGLLVAAAEPFKQWLVVALVGAGKLAAGTGLLWGVASNRYPPRAAWFAVVNDLIWLPALGLILNGAYESAIRKKRTIAPDVVRMALRVRTQYDVSLDELSRLSPIMTVFLRHAGCTFCREALSDLSARRAELERLGVRIVLVHMSSEEHAAQFFTKYGLEDVPRVSDPQRNLYRAFGLRRGSIGDLIGPKVWWRGFTAGVLRGHGVGRFVGDVFQMPGIFLIFHGEIVRSYRHQSAADRPDYLALASGRDYVRAELRS